MLAGHRAVFAIVAAAFALAACAQTNAPQTYTPAVAERAPGGGAHTQQIHAIPIGTPPPTVNTCGSGLAQCHAKERVDLPALPNSPTLTPSQIPGLHPSDIASAYSLPVTNGSAATIAIVVAYSDPNAERDLAVYRSKFGLTPCTVASGCLRFYGALNEAKLPPAGGPGQGRADPGWATETSIDLQMASAACPRCKLAVFEAKDDSVTSLIAAELAAVTAHPSVISNSWSISESSALAVFSGRFVHQGIAVVAGSGDNAFTVSWPAVEPNVIAVGGTSLVRDSSTARGWTEAGWKNAGYGCSMLNARPWWQPATLCGTQRAVADIAAVADPLTGVAIYNTYGTDKAHPGSSGGWEVYGGTSVAAPIVAGAIALAGNAPQLSNAAYIYQHASALNPVYSALSPLQTGLGSPNGTAAL